MALLITMITLNSQSFKASVKSFFINETRSYSKKGMRSEWKKKMLNKNRGRIFDGQEKTPWPRFHARIEHLLKRRGLWRTLAAVQVNEEDVCLFSALSIAIYYICQASQLGPSSMIQVSPGGPEAWQPNCP